MKLTAKILKFKDKKLETVEEVRAALIAILEDIESGDATITEAKPIRDETKMIMRKLRAQMKAQSQRTRPRSSHSLESKRCMAYAPRDYFYLFVAGLFVIVATLWLSR